MVGQRTHSGFFALSREIRGEVYRQCFSPTYRASVELRPKPHFFWHTDDRLPNDYRVFQLSNTVRSEAEDEFYRVCRFTFDMTADRPRSHRSSLALTERVKNVGFKFRIWWLIWYSRSRRDHSRMMRHWDALLLCLSSPSKDILRNRFQIDIVNDTYNPKAYPDLDFFWQLKSLSCFKSLVVRNETFLRNDGFDIKNCWYLKMQSVRKDLETSLGPGQIEKEDLSATLKFRPQEGRAAV